MAVEYTKPGEVTDTRVTAVPLSGQTVTGYGGKIPTRHMIRYLDKWRRVYVMIYGNSGSAYVLVLGKTVFLDPETEHNLRRA